MAEKVEQQKAWLPGLFDQAVEGLQGLAREGAKQLDQVSLEEIPREQLLTLSNAGIGPKKLREAKAKLAGLLKEFSDGVQDKKKLERMRAEIDTKHRSIAALVSSLIDQHKIRFSDMTKIAEAHLALAEIRGTLSCFPKGQGQELKLENAVLQSRLYRVSGKYEQAWNSLEEAGRQFEKHRDEISKALQQKYELRLSYERACVALLRYLLSQKDEPLLADAVLEWQKMDENTEWLTAVEARYFKHLLNRAIEQREHGWQSASRSAESLRVGPVDSQLVYSQAAVSSREIAVEDFKLSKIVAAAREEKRQLAVEAERMLNKYLKSGYFDPQAYIDFKIKAALADYKEEHPEAAAQAGKIEEWILEVLSDIKRRSAGKPFLEAIELARREFFPLLRKYHPDYASILSPKLFGWANCVTRSGNSLMAAYAARPQPDPGYVYGFGAFDGHDAGLLVFPPSDPYQKAEGEHYDLFEGGEWKSERKAPIYHPVYEYYEYAQKQGGQTLNIDLSKLLIAAPNVRSPDASQVIRDVDEQAVGFASGRAGSYGDAPLGPSESFWTPMGGPGQADRPYRPSQGIQGQAPWDSEREGFDPSYLTVELFDAKKEIVESVSVPYGEVAAAWNSDGSLDRITYYPEPEKALLYDREHYKELDPREKEEVAAGTSDIMAYIVNRDRRVWETTLASLADPFDKDISVEKLRVTLRMLESIDMSLTVSISQSVFVQISNESKQRWLKENTEGRNLVKASRALGLALRDDPQGFIRKLAEQDWQKQRMILQLLSKLDNLSSSSKEAVSDFRLGSSTYAYASDYVSELAWAARPAQRIHFDHRVELIEDPNSINSQTLNRADDRGKKLEESPRQSESRFEMEEKLWAHIMGKFFLERLGMRYPEKWTPRFNEIWADFFQDHPAIVVEDYFEGMMQMIDSSRKYAWSSEWQGQLESVTFIDESTSKQNPNPANTSVTLRLPLHGNPKGSREYKVAIPKPLYKLIQKMQPIYERQQEVRFGQ